MTDNVTPINGRDPVTGRMLKGYSGNPAGVSKHQAAVKSLSRDQKAVLSSMFTVMVPSVQKALKTLMVKKDISDDNLIRVCKIVLEYGVGRPTTVIETNNGDANDGDVDLSNLDPAVLKAMADKLNDISKGM
jgi:hypothetical protein